jgi:uncharacterized protein (TIGR03435 family)
MLRTLLEDRFQMKAHPENKNQPAGTVNVKTGGYVPIPHSTRPRTPKSIRT